MISLRLSGVQGFIRRIAVCAIAGILAQVLGAASPKLTKEGFIPRKVLFQDYDWLAEARLSPDGRYMVGQRLKEVGGGDFWLVTFSWDFQTQQLNILNDGRKTFVRDIGFSADDQIVYSYFTYPMSQPWYAAHPQGGKAMNLIGENQTSRNQHLAGANLVDRLIDDPENALFATQAYRISGRGYRSDHWRFNIRGDGGQGIWKINTRTGDAALLIRDAYVTWKWWCDAEGNPALAESFPEDSVDSDGRFKEKAWWEKVPRSLYLIEEGGFGRRLPLGIGPVQHDHEVIFDDPVFSADRTQLYYLSQAQTDRVAIMEMDLDTLESTVYREDTKDDITRIIRDPYLRTMIGYRTAGGKGKEVYFDRSLAGLQKAMEDVFPNEMPRIVNWDRHRDKFLLWIRSAQSPGKYYLFDRGKMAVEPVMELFEKLAQYKLSAMEVIEYTARDGLKIEGYLTRPQRLGPKGPYPLILYVHGGPWARDFWGFDDMVQFLADRGYAVLQVNFRGSEGYGKTFLNAGNKQWGRTMQDDLTDAVEWAIDQGITTRDRVGIMGASYGGYATMAGLTFTPDLYQVGLAGMGVYDLTRHTSEFEHYHGEDFQYVPEIWAKRMGDEVEDAELLRAASPIFFVDRVKAPVFVFHGQHDRTVHVDQSFRLMKALKRAGKQAESHYLGETGHSYGDEDRQAKLAKAMEKFLRKYFPSDLMK